MLSIPAYAKINLTLDVLGKRPDGYHEIASVLQTISLADTLHFQLDKEIRLICDPPSTASHDDLVVRAARLLQETARCGKGASIQLTKVIPVAAGLGGGSSDAAAALEGLNRLWELGLSHERLLELAPRLSSDTAFFLYGGTALAEGRGEKVTPLPPFPDSWLVLVKPSIATPPNKTEKLYAKLNPYHFTQGQSTQRLVRALRQHTPVSPSLLGNSFETIAFEFFPELAEYRQWLLNAGATNVHLAGAGPALFSLVSSQAQGEELCHRLQAKPLESYLVQTVEAGNSGFSTS